MNKNLFNSIQLRRPKSNVFDLSHDFKLSLDPGKLIPTCIFDCVPGDKVKCSAESLLRFAPLISPMMHQVNVYFHWFFVPNRILWPGWEKFITGGQPGDTIPAFPYIVGNTTGNMVNDKLYDYLGVPTPIAGQNENINAMPFAAYQAVYNEYFRDQNLVQPIPYALIDGDNSNNTELFNLRYRAWEHDYFTSALPWAQKGDSVSLPLGDVVLKADTSTSAMFVKKATDHTAVANDTLVTGAVSDMRANTANAAVVLDPQGTLSVAPTTVNDLRRAFRLQEWLERNARGGSRYVEQIRAHFDVISSDKRLQRPEYISGSKAPVVISEVLNTSDTTNAPQGNMSGHAIAISGGKYGSYFCEEHGFIICMMSVLPRTAYQQGLAKMFLKTTDRFQYYWPEFANIGEQEVLRKELYAFSAAGANTFGYVPRYSEYKYMPSRVAGDFRTTLDFWHWGRKFTSSPSLNQSFIECQPSTRVFAVTGSTNKLYAHVFNKITAVRPMPKFGTPQF